VQIAVIQRNCSPAARVFKHASRLRQASTASGVAAAVSGSQVAGHLPQLRCVLERDDVVDGVGSWLAAEPARWVALEDALAHLGELVGRAAVAWGWHGCHLSQAVGASLAGGVASTQKWRRVTGALVKSMSMMPRCVTRRKGHRCHVWLPALCPCAQARVTKPQPR